MVQVKTSCSLIPLNEFECVLSLLSLSFKLLSFVAETILCYIYVCIATFILFVDAFWLQSISSHTGATISAKMHVVV
jgi:hypothetical protein